MTNLLPCPFCGNSATIRHDTSSGHERQWTWGVNCDDWDDCGASITGAASRDAAIALWNRHHRTSVYAHRNGETEAPTVPGKYWFDGVCHGANTQAMFNIVINDDSAGWYPLGDALCVSYGGMGAFSGQWWGPVVPPWEGAQ